MAFIEPLNLEEILVNKFAGTGDVFTLLALVLIAVFAAKFRMPLGAFMIVVSVFIFIFYSSGVLAGGLLWGLLTIMVIGLAFVLSRAMSRALG